MLCESLTHLWIRDSLEISFSFGEQTTILNYVMQARNCKDFTSQFFKLKFRFYINRMVDNFDLENFGQFGSNDEIWKIANSKVASLLNICIRNRIEWHAI